MMHKKILFYVLIGLVQLVSLSIFVTAQTNQTNQTGPPTNQTNVTYPEINLTYFFGAAPPGTLFNITNVTTSNGTNVSVGTVCIPPGPGVLPCNEFDGGYNPTVQSSFAGFFHQVFTYVLPGATYWSFGYNPAYWPGSFAPPANICVQQATEICKNPWTLYEAVCGSSVGVTAQNFNTLFPGNYWLDPWQPVALLEVNCGAYAANHPGQALGGGCSAGRCV